MMLSGIRLWTSCFRDGLSLEHVTRGCSCALTASQLSLNASVASSSGAGLCSTSARQISSSASCNAKFQSVLRKRGTQSTLLTQENLQEWRRSQYDVSVGVQLVERADAAAGRAKGSRNHVKDLQNQALKLMTGVTDLHQLREVVRELGPFMDARCLVTAITRVPRLARSASSLPGAPGALWRPSLASSAAEQQQLAGRLFDRLLPLLQPKLGELTPRQVGMTVFALGEMSYRLHPDQQAVLLPPLLAAAAWIGKSKSPLLPRSVASLLLGCAKLGLPASAPAAWNEVATAAVGRASAMPLQPLSQALKAMCVAGQHLELSDVEPMTGHSLGGSSAAAGGTAGGTSGGTAGGTSLASVFRSLVGGTAGRSAGGTAQQQRDAFVAAASNRIFTAVAALGSEDQQQQDIGRDAAQPSDHSEDDRDDEDGGTPRVQPAGQRPFRGLSQRPAAEHAESTDLSDVTFMAHALRSISVLLPPGRAPAPLFSAVAGILPPYCRALPTTALLSAVQAYSRTGLGTQELYEALCFAAAMRVQSFAPDRLRLLLSHLTHAGVANPPLSRLAADMLLIHGLSAHSSAAAFGTTSSAFSHNSISSPADAFADALHSAVRLGLRDPSYLQRAEALIVAAAPTLSLSGAQAMLAAAAGLAAPPPAAAAAAAAAAPGQYAARRSASSASLLPSRRCGGGAGVPPTESPLDRVVRALDGVTRRVVLGPSGVAAGGALLSRPHRGAVTQLHKALQTVAERSTVDVSGTVAELAEVIARKA